MSEVPLYLDDIIVVVNEVVAHRIFRIKTILSHLSLIGR